MNYLLLKHRVAGFARWPRVFESHAAAQRQAGLHLLHLLRDTGDPDLVVMLFRIDDLDKARAFTESPRAAESAEVSGVIGVPEVLILAD
jgi:heme-degrading monooxygenase HmoA